MPAGLRLMITSGKLTRIGCVSLAGQVTDAEPYVARPHRVVPDRWVLSLVTAGRGAYIGTDGPAAPIRGGTLVLIPPGVPHWYGTDPGQRWTEFFAVFAGPMFDSLAGAGVLTDQVIHHPRPAPRTASLTALLGAEPRSQRQAEMQVVGLAHWLIDVLAPDEPVRYSPEITDAVALLDADQAAQLSMPEVARRVGLGYDVFRRRFTAELGQSPLQYRNERRLQTAARLLQMTNLTTRAIARTLGYADEFHLSRRFRAAYGVSPSEHRGPRGLCSDHRAG